MEPAKIKSRARGKYKRTITKITKIKEEQESTNESSNDTKEEEDTKNQESKLTCDICGKTYCTVGYVEEHKARHHSNEKPFKCLNCPKSFVTRGDLRQHSKTHTKEKAYKCELCDKSYSRASLRNYHMRKHTGERPYKCNQCSQTFTRPFILRQHTIRAHGRDDASKDICEFCGKEFLSAGGLHDLTYHLGTHTKPFTCPEKECGLAFAVKEGLRNHQLKCHRSAEEMFSCDTSDCSKKFKTKVALNSHLYEAHKDKLYHCPLPACVLRFPSKSGLNRHLRASKSHVKMHA